MLKTWVKFRWWRAKARLASDVIDTDAIMADFEAKRIAPTKRRNHGMQSKRTNGCPTPGKRAYSSLAAARNARGKAMNKGTRMKPYRCSCGDYHLARRES